MNKKNILPQQGQPVIRLTAGQLSSQLAELSEEALGDAGLEASVTTCITFCAYDGVEPSCTLCCTLCAYDGE
uniref:Patellamide protein n=1 Tax=uncultured Prochloron sp. TaxID=259942 RepID=A0MHA2_9PROC|nr:patellamide precursor protein [uncultured Prochloron sp.]